MDAGYSVNDVRLLGQENATGQAVPEQAQQVECRSATIRPRSSAGRRRGWCGCGRATFPRSTCRQSPSRSGSLRLLPSGSSCPAGRHGKSGAATFAVGAGWIGDRTPGGLEAFEDKPHRHRAFSDGGRGPFD